MSHVAEIDAGVRAVSAGQAKGPTIAEMISSIQNDWQLGGPVETLLNEGEFFLAEWVARRVIERDNESPQDRAYNWQALAAGISNRVERGRLKKDALRFVEAAFGHATEIYEMFEDHRFALNAIMAEARAHQAIHGDARAAAFFRARAARFYRLGRTVDCGSMMVFEAEELRRRGDFSGADSLYVSAVMAFHDASSLWFNQERARGETDVSPYRADAARNMRVIMLASEGRRLEQSGDFKAAAEFYDRALTLASMLDLEIADWGFFEQQMVLGRDCMHEGNYPWAINHFRYAMRNITGAFYPMGNVHFDSLHLLFGGEAGGIYARTVMKPLTSWAWFEGPPTAVDEIVEADMRRFFNEEGAAAAGGGLSGDPLVSGGTSLLSGAASVATVAPIGPIACLTAPRVIV